MSPIELSWTAKKEKHKRQIDFSLKKMQMDEHRWQTLNNTIELILFPSCNMARSMTGRRGTCWAPLGWGDTRSTPSTTLWWGGEFVLCQSQLIIISLRGWELRYPICCTRTVGFDLIQLDCIAQTRRPIKGIDSQSQVQVQDVKLFCSVDPGEQLDCDESRPCSRSGHFQLSDLQKDFQVSSFEQSIAIILCHLLHLLP